MPIFSNDQDMERFSTKIKHELAGCTVPGFLIGGHGLYAWGQSIAEARRHIEVFEFLSELALRMGCSMAVLTVPGEREIRETGTKSKRI